MHYFAPNFVKVKGIDSVQDTKLVPDSFRVDREITSIYLTPRFVRTGDTEHDDGCENPTNQRHKRKSTKHKTFLLLLTSLSLSPHSHACPTNGANQNTGYVSNVLSSSKMLFPPLPVSQTMKFRSDWQLAA